MIPARFEPGDRVRWVPRRHEGWPDTATVLGVDGGGLEERVRIRVDHPPDRGDDGVRAVYPERLSMLEDPVR